MHADIAKENIGYGKLSQDARQYEKLVESTHKESDNNEKKKFAIQI